MLKSVIHDMSPLQLFCVPNLVSKDVVPCVPWAFTGTPPPEVCGKAGKKERDKWITRPTTNWQVYSAFEGIITNQRVTASKGTDEGNPPLKCHALIADIDAPVTDVELQAGLGRIKHVPNYFERTLSGNVRLIWLLEKPVSFPNYRFAQEWLRIALTHTKFDQVAGGFDKPAWEEPNRLYTNSGNWMVVDAGARIPFDLANGWIVETSEKHLWRKDRGSVEIPLPEVFKEIEKKWPAHGWPGDFEEGSQGPTFWLDGSASPKSAIVKPTGMFTFSSTASQPFYSWADLVGIDFVREYAAKAMGKAVEGIYHDGTTYYRTTGYGQWKGFSKEDVCGHLRVDRGLTGQKQGDQPSEVDRAVQFIQNWNGIDGAAPFVFQPRGLIQRSGGTFLNTHGRKVTPPAATGSWGPDGEFPWLSKLYDGLFDPPEQLDFFLSWLSRFYKGAYEYNLESGQNVFILGPQGVGKSLLSQGILPRLMGGAHDAESYLLGKSEFNSQLFDVALWTVDDNSANVDPTTHRRFSAMIKKMAANTTFAYHAKFRIPCAVDWLGRVLVTANDDEQSARIVPDLSISILDKLMLFRTCQKPPVDFPSRQQLTAILDRELPHFARFLLNYQIPENCRGPARFGVKAYHEATLLETAEQSSSSAVFKEVVDDWAKDYFREKADQLFWEGTSLQFLKKLHQGDLAISSAIRGLTLETVPRHFMSLKVKGFVGARSEGAVRLWRINNPQKRKVPGGCIPITSKPIISPPEEPAAFAAAV